MSGFEVIKSGIFTLIQDRGRFGLTYLGVTNSGVMDEYASFMAHKLLQNPMDANILEIIFGNIELKATSCTTVITTGALCEFFINDEIKQNWKTYKINTGDVIKIGKILQGQRVYLAVKNGFDIKKEFGSNSTTIKESLGGISGTQIKNAADGRRAATDLTLSPNKTVSLQALVFGDDRLIDAHDKAVEKTLAYAESLAAYRISNNGETQMVQSGNITAATFRHETSRDLDPALHTHCVLLNVTQTQEGGWKALNVTQIYKQQKLMTAYYRSELANEVQKLGYGIERTHNDGRFELAGFSREQVEAFSQRTSAIEKYLEERGKTSKTASASEKELATLATRQNKQKVDRSELSSEWKARAKELGIENAVPSYEQGKNIDRVKGADESVKYAVEHLTERNSIVTKNEIVQTALESGVGKTGIKEIEKSIERSVDRGDLIQSKDRFTTNEAQVRERQMLNMEERGRGAVTQISNDLTFFLNLLINKYNSDSQI